MTGRLAVPGEAARDFQPMNINFGLFPPIDQPVRDTEGKRLRGTAKTLERKRALSRRALRDFEPGSARRAAPLLDTARRASPKSVANVVVAVFEICGFRDSTA